MMIASFHNVGRSSVPCLEWILLSAALLFMEQAVVTLAQTTAPTALGQCQEGEVLLEIRNTHEPMEGFVDMNIVVLGPLSALGLESPETDEEMRESFSFYQTIIPPDKNNGMQSGVSMCVPEDQCLTASIGIYASLPYLDYSVEKTRYNFSPQEVTLIYNGQIVSDIKGPFPYTQDGVQLVAELGTNCTVVCDPDDEVLLELETVLVGIVSYDWQILDYATGELFYGCPPSNMIYSDSRCYWSEVQYYHERICLPKDGCFGLLAGEADPQVYVDVIASTLNVTLDGKQLPSLNHVQIGAIPLLRADGGNSSSSCPSWSSPCAKEGEDDESEVRLLEMFIFRNEIYMEDYPELTWSLTSVTVGNDSGGEVPLTEQGNLGTGVIQYGDRPIKYQRVCVPRNDSCVRFDLYINTSYDNETYPIGAYYESDYYWLDSYRLVMDGIVYGAAEHRFEHTQFLGGEECNAFEVCAFGDLLQVDLVTGPPSTNWYPSNVHWGLYNHHMDDDFASSPVASYRGNVLPDETHRYFVCFQSFSDDGSCTAVGVDVFGVNSGAIAQYSISVSSREDYRIEYHNDYYSWRDSYTIWSTISGDCTEPPSSNVSQGAIIGLSIGGAFVALCCCVGLYKLHARRSPQLEGGGVTRDIAAPKPLEEDQERPLDSPHRESGGGTTNNINNYSPGNGNDDDDEEEA